MSSFQTADQWPEGLINIFELARAASLNRENHCCGAYNKLLTYCFPADDFHYFVSPLYLPASVSLDTVAFVICLVVYNHGGKPVLFVEVKDDFWAASPGLRVKADGQIREKFDELLHECPLPELWAISVLGTSMRIYRGTKATLELHPLRVPRPHEDLVLSSNFLANEWQNDILSQAGFQAVKNIVADIKEAAR
jgi:hypothetical protein